MKEKFKKVTVVVKEKWSGFSKAVKIAVCAVPVALIAIIIILANVFSNKGTTVLYSGLTNAEATEIASAITNMGISDVKLNANGDVIVPSDQADELRMQLSVQGYPKGSTDYSIWNDGVDLWSTDRDKREVARQQREANIAATLRRLNTIRDAAVNLSIPETRDYVITNKEEIPTCAVIIQLQDGEELTNAEVRAIFALVSKSVDGLTYDNISVTDTQGRSYQWIDPADDAADEKDASGTNVAYRRLQFQRDIQMAIKNTLDDQLTKMFGKNGYTIGVTAILDFDAKRVVSTEYIPVDENNTGVLEHEDNVETNTTLNNKNGLVGTEGDSDLSPDYPTYNGVDDGQTYYYRKNEKQYDVTNIKTVTERDGYKVERLSVGVGVNQTNMTEAERESIEQMVAASAGTDVENVHVHYMPFTIDNEGINGGIGNNGGVIITPADRNRNMLIILVIVLGVILIGLLIASLMMSRSRKKRIRKRQEQALAAAQAAALDNTNNSERPETPQEVDFNIASLTEEAGKESRETILKREIAEFAKSSPDIVASIIRNMIREEGD